jgi:DNA-directed RNA polymerase specialized sigma24 family protein
MDRPPEPPMTNDFESLVFELGDLIDRADLTSFDRHSLYLRFYQGLSLDQTARELRVSPDQIRLSLNSSLSKLKKLLSERTDP